MKLEGMSMNRTVLIGAMIVLISLAITGSVAAADMQAPDPIGYENTTSHGMQVRDRMINGSIVGGPDHQPGAWGAFPALGRGAIMMHGAGIIHAAFLFFIAILAVLLLLVWLAVGVLLIVLLLKKLGREKTP
jgi:hypothetical protein